MSDFDYPVTVSVFDEERYDGDWIPESLTDAIAWLHSKLDAIPSEYRSTGEIDIDSVGSWENSHYARITIKYTRPATPDEIATRTLEAERRLEQERGRAQRELADAVRRLAELAASIEPPTSDAHGNHDLQADAVKP